ncbi:MAG: hypothetical protein HYY46_23655 [Deltaproteobacteria bacterium]|nr:hypothetical protein [Deltaproteobacteria bacterium]
MRGVLAAVLTVLLSSGPICGAPGKAGAQEKESIPDRVLNPMPEYNPFDPPPPPPRFFPDEVDKRVRAAFIDSLTWKGKLLENNVRFFQEKDRELREARGTVTGLTDKVRDLYLAESRENSDELGKAEELLRKSSANRFAAVVNRLLSSVDLLTIVSGSYAGAAVDSAMSQLFTIGQPKMSIEERKALALYRSYLKRYPESPQSGQIQKQIEALEKRKQTVVVQKRLEKAEEAVGKGELSRAEFQYEMAALIDPQSSQVKKGLEKLRERIRQQEQSRQRALSVSNEGTSRAVEPEDQLAFKELLHALAVREPGRIEAVAKAVEENNRGRPLGDSAKDALAVAAEIKGQHEEAKKILKEIARSSSDPHERRRAESFLEDPEYNLLASLEKARSQHRLQTVKYVLLGDDLLKRNLIYGTAPLVVSGPAGATTLAAANVLMIGTNLFEVLTANPISPQPVIDKAVAYIRSHPDSDSAADVYTLLAESYENTGKYDRALLYHQLSGKASAKKLTDLKGKAAQSLLQAAEKSGDRATSELALKTLLDNYPESEAAKVATQKLAQLMKIENQGFHISKKFLLEHPDLYGPQGLRLKSTLFDGDLSNMELADRGINLLSEQEIVLHFQTPWGIQSQAYHLAKEDSDRLLMALRGKQNENPDQLKGLPSALLEGDLAKKGGREEAGDTALSLVREAPGAPTRFPKVLDYELLSETEKRPGGLFKLPQIQGSASASRFNLSGSFPAGLWGNRLTVGTDEKSPFAGIQLPIPLLQGFIPVDFLLQARPDRFSVFPKIHQFKDQGDDGELYR